MDIRVLRYFLAVARQGSITGAANSLHVTQPTLSRQMMELEEELGRQLFNRGSRNISLTSEGMILRKRAEEIIDLVDKTKTEFRFMEEVIAGDIYIGSGETKGVELIAEVIKELRKEYPEIKFHLYSGNAEDVSERIDKGLLDFGILIQPTDLSKYDFITLPVKDIWGVVMSKHSPLAKKMSVTKQDLAGLPLICSRQALTRTSSHNEFLDWFGKDFAKMNIISTFNLVFNAAILAEQEIGYVLTLDKLVNTMEHSAVCFRPLHPALESGLNIVWKKYQVFSPAAKVFLEKLQTKFH